MTEETERTEKQKEAEQRLAEKEARIAELERNLTGKEQEIAGLKQSGQEMERRLAALGGSLSEAVGSYRTAVIRANPEAIGGLVSGESIADIDESLAKAKELVGKVRQGVERENSQARVPAGAPERRAPDLSALSAREKIQMAMGKR